MNASGRTLALSLSFAALVFSAAAWAQSPGDLHAGLNPGTGADSRVLAVARHADGRLIVGGQFTVFNGLSRLRLTQLNYDGSTDTSFDPGTAAAGTINAVAAAAGGKVVVGGDFLSFNGVARSRLARLNANGSVDTAFAPTVNGTVQAVAVQPDGKVLLAGGFSAVNGITRNRVARLNSDGSLDGTFDPGAGPNSSVLALTLQADGRVLVGGYFWLFNGVTRNRVARLNANGSLDTDFVPGTHDNGYVSGISVGADGKVFVCGGLYVGLNSRILRLHPTGALDTGFNPGNNVINSDVTCAVAQDDGKVVIGGYFTAINGIARRHVARLNTSGTLDTAFNPGVGASDYIWTMIMEPDGALVAGGAFTTYQGVSRNRLTRIQNSPPLNPPPQMDVIASLVVAEDSGPVTVNVTGIAPGSPGEVGRAVTNLTATSYATGILPHPTVTYTPGGATATLTLHPVADANGTVTVSVVVQDNGPTAATGVRTFTVTVTPVNDAPSFVLGVPVGSSNITIAEDSGAYSAASFASSISAGPANESAQTVTFLTSNTASNLFSAQPVIAANGTLSFTPAANAFGSATVTVVAVDSGGAPGVSSSAAQTFTIEITNLNDPPAVAFATNNVVVLEDAAAASSNAFLSLSAGPFGEPGTASLISVANNNNGLFTVQPFFTGSTLGFTAAPNAHGVATVTVIAQDDTLPTGLFGTNTFTITVLPVNDAPTLTLGVTTINVLTNVGTVTTNLAAVTTVGPANETGQSITNYSVSNDNNALFSVQPALALNGTLTFTVAGHLTGSANVSVRAQDNGGTLNGGVNLSPVVNVTINVGGPNQVPTFSLATNNVVVAEDSGAASVSAFLTSLSAGEVTQSVTNLAVSNNNSSLFSAPPAIAPDGTLTFTPAPDANGVATVTVRATDNGIAPATGTQTFTITVTAVNDAPSFALRSSQVSMFADYARFAILPDPPFFSVSGYVEGNGVVGDGGGQDVADNLFAGLTALGVSPVTFTDFNQVLNTSRAIVVPPLDHGDLGTALNVATKAGISNYVAGGGRLVILVDEPGVNATSFLNQIFGFALTTQPGVLSGTASQTANAAGSLFAGNANPLPVNNRTVPINPASLPPGARSIYEMDATRSVVGIIPVGAGQIVYLSWDWFFSAPANGGGQDNGWQAILGNAMPPVMSLTVLEDSGTQTFSGLATNILAGPANESAQSLVFITSNTASNLFSSQPVIAANGTLTFTPAPNAWGTITVSVRAQDNGGTANGGVDTSAVQTFTITITNINDPPAITFATNNLVVSEDAGSVSRSDFLSLSPGPFNEPGTVAITSLVNNNNSLFSVQPAFTGGTLTFTPAANTFGVATVTVVAQDDTLPTGLFSTNSFTITVLSVNDAPTLTLTNLLINLLTNAGGYSANLGATVSVGPPNESGQGPVSFLITNNNNSLFSTQPYANQGGFLSFSVAPGVQGTATLYVRVRDTGGTANGGVDVSEPVLVTVNITPGNAAPSFTLGATSITLNEDAGPITSNLFLTALSPGPQPLDASQTVTLTVVNNNPSLFSAQPALSGGGATRDLTFTPAANASGVATVTITATDNGTPPLSTARTVTISVLSVNDAPVITLASANIALENAGAQSLSGFATITTGPAAESSQTITNLSVSNDNSALFSVQPALAANGTLTFTPVLNASGVATVTVIAQDNGGTANGGVDKATNTFTIAIAVVNQAPSFNLRLANTQASPLANGSFETGDFTGWTVSDTANTTPSLAVRANGANLGIFNVLSTDGTSSATHGFGGTSEGLISIGQDVVVPANATAQVTFTYRIAWNTIGSTATSNRVFRVSVQPAGGGTELGGQTLLTAEPNTFGVQTVNQTGSLDLTPYAGQTVRLAFVAIIPAGDTANGAFQLDNVSVTVNTPDFSVLENSGASSTLNFATNILAGPANESAQTVAFQVSNNNTALFSSQPAIAANGTLTFTPAADANGAATVTVVAQDNGGTANGGVDTSAPRTFLITVLPVNSAPRVTVTLANVTVNEDSAAFSGTVATITTGPADESSQSITNMVTSNDKNSLFSVQPAVSASGVLTFTLAAHQNGSATVTFTAQDNGGTANGGVNQTTRTLTITVTPVNDAPSFVLPAGTGTAQLTTVSTLAGSTSGSADGTGAGAQFNSPYAVAADSVGNVYVADYGNHRIRKITPAGVVTTFAGSTAGYADGTGAAAQFNQPFAVAVDGADNVFVGEYGNNRIRKITPGGVVTTPSYTNSAGAAFSFGLPVALTFDAAGNLYTVHSYSGILKITPNGLVTVLAGVAGYSVGYVDGTGGAARFDNPLGLAADSAGNVYVSEYGNDISRSHIRKITPAGVVTTLAGSTYGFADGTGTAAQFRWLWGVVVDPSGTVYVADTGNNCIRKITAAGVVTTLSSTAGYVDGALSTAKFANPLGMAMDRSGNIYVADQGNQKIRKIASAIPSFELTVLEDSGAYTTNTFATSISAGPADEAAQTVSFTVSNNNNPLFSSQPAIAADGTLTFTPAANAFGSATVTVTAVDSGSGTPPDVNTSAAQTFTITVTPVNDRPSVTLAGNVTRNEDSGAHSQSSFATFSAGNAGESGQAVLAYNVANNNSSLFSVQPAINPSGTLTFTPAANSNGVATVTVSVRDNGGTANGGVDTSAEVTFTITINSVNDAPSFALNGGVLNSGSGGGGGSGDGLIVGGATYYPAGGATVLVAPDLTYSNSVSSTTAGAAVSIDNGQTGDVLGFNSTLATSYGISGTYNSTTKVLSFTGSATTAQYQEVLRSVTYSNASGTPTSDRTISFNVGLNTLYNPLNGHFYEYVPTVVTWAAAESAATNRIFQGMRGYLATITSQEENDFIRTKLLADAWIGGSDDVNYVNRALLALGLPTYADQNAAENKWYWVTGPEAGQQFSTGSSSFSGRYQNWAGGEPNNSGSEHYAQFYYNNNGRWNDLRSSHTLAYMVEYGGQAGDVTSTLALSGFRTLTYNPVLQVTENSGLNTFSLALTNISAGPADESAQLVDFLVSNNNSPLFTIPPAFAADGTLTFTLAANAFGSATVTVQARDDGGTANGGVNTSAAKTFTIVVNNVNEAPTVAFSSGTVTALEDSGTQTVSGFATVTSFGVGESSQTLVGHVLTAGNPALFSVQPAINTSGVLTFTPATNANGSTTVTVVSQDSGGTAGGGVDKTTNTFTIAITPVNDAPGFAIDTSLLSGGSTLQTNVLAWGLNTSGQTNVPPDLNGALAVAGGYTFNLAIKTDRTVVAWGNNFRGAVAIPGGSTPATNGNGFVSTGLSGVTAIAGGGFFAVAARSDGTVVAWGDNDYGQTNVPGGLVNVTAVACGAYHALALKSDGTVVAWGRNASGAATVPAGLTGVTAIAGGAYSFWPFSLALKSDGTVVGWGDNSYGAISIPGGLTGVTAIAAGGRHALALRSNGTVVAWGNNEFGQTTVPAGLSGVVAISAGAEHSLALKGDGTVVAWGHNAHGQSTVPSGLSGVRAISAGSWHSLALYTNIAVLPPSILTVSEDSGVFSASDFATSISAGPADESGQVVSFTVTNNNNPLFSSQPAIAANGTLTFTPVPNAFGTATVTVRAHDNGGVLNGGVDTSAAQTFTITVTPVNDAPTVAFSAATVTVLEDSGLKTVSGFATVTSFGSGETGQTLLGHVVTSDNTALFSVQPAINNSGTLTFTPALNANGSATVTVVSQDSGGTANGGVDKATNTFTITVTPVNDVPGFALNGGVLNTGSGGGGGSGDGLIVGGATYYPAGGATVLVAPDLTYSNSVSSTTAGAAVSIDNGQTGDVLGFDATLATSYGISGIYNSTTKVLSFTGSATTAQYQEVLRSVTYSNASGTPTSDRTISFNVGLNTLYNPLNGHFYEYVSASVTWPQAKTLAEDRTFQGMRGYLATVTSQAENDFIRSKMQADAWIGGSDDASYINAAVGSTLYSSQGAAEGKWYWVTGPEKGQQFSQNNSPSMTSFNGMFQNWAPGEPNDAGGEHYAQFYYNNNGRWNDLPNSSRLSYMVEYGGQTGDVTSSLSLSGSRTLTYNPVLQVAENSGLNTFSLALTNISAGPANESGQVVSFVVSNDNNALFSVQPAIAANGTLTFTPAASGYGTATVTVRARDDGGTDDGGVDTSAARTFTITLTPVPTRVYLSGATPAGPQGETVVVPIMLDGLGTESAVGFTLNFDASKLTFTGATVGAGVSGSSVSILRNLSQVGSGRLGLVLTKDLGLTFAAGTTEMLLITFNVSADAALGATPVTFTDVVTRREVANSLANAVPAAFVDGSVTISAATVGTPSNLEGDVSPRPFGNGTVTVTDSVQISRFAAGLDIAGSANGEFQRADCAPLASKGDGRMTVADWLQAQRFAAGLDTPGTAGGPTVQATALFAASAKLPAGTRVVRVVGGNLVAGQANTVSVQLDAQGNEAGISLSLAFDPTALTFVSATTTSGGSLMVNSVKAAAGKLGLVLVMPAGSTIAAGTKDIVTLTFNVSGSGATAIGVTGDSPVAREVADVNANVLGASFVGGSFNIILPAGLKAAGLERAADGSVRLVVRNSDGTPVTAAQAAKYEVHVTSNLGGAWTVLPNALVLENGALKIVDPAAGAAGLRLYKLVETP